MLQCLRHGMSSARLRAIALLLVTPGLFAVVQDSAGAEATTADTTDTALHEIVVTAERRDSTVQKTPIRITALTGQQLRELGVSTAQGVVQSVPGVEVSSAGPGQAKYEIRGLSSDGGDAATVGF